MRLLGLVRLACAGFLLAVSSPVVAQTPANCPNPSAVHRTPSPQRIAAMQTMRQACAADEAQFCAGVPAQCGQRRQCMMSHAAQLSATCAGAMQNLRATR
jgi:hypothetical protein